MLITSLENEKVKLYRKLREKKYRDKTGFFLVEGMHLVLEAYKAGVIEEVILEQDEVLPFAVPFVYVTNDIIHKISLLETPSKVMALCRKLDEKVDTSSKRILALDGIQDPGNLGTIIRSAVAFDIDLIVLGDNCVDLYNDKVIRSTQGMIFHSKVVRCNLKAFLEKKKEEGLPIYGTRVEYGEDVRYFKEKDKNSFVLVMGNEGNGLSEEVQEMCDAFLYIPMNEQVESLNVAVASSILLYELKERS